MSHLAVNHPLHLVCLLMGSLSVPPALFQICKSKAKESQQYYHSLAVRQSLPVHFNIQQDCGHFLAEVPSRLLPWEDPDAPEKAEDGTEDSEEEGKAETLGGNPEPSA